jgi:hypothetical protein
MRLPKAAMKGSNSFAVPSIPGRSTSSVM